MKKVLAASYLLSRCSIPGAFDPEPEPLRYPDCNVYPDNPYCIEQREKASQSDEREPNK